MTSQKTIADIVPSVRNELRNCEEKILDAERRLEELKGHYSQTVGELVVFDVSQNPRDGMKNAFDLVFGFTQESEDYLVQEKEIEFVLEKYRLIRERNLRKLVHIFEDFCRLYTFFDVEECLYVVQEGRRLVACLHEDEGSSSHQVFVMACQFFLHEFPEFELQSYVMGKEY